MSNAHCFKTNIKHFEYEKVSILSHRAYRGTLDFVL